MGMNIDIDIYFICNYTASDRHVSAFSISLRNFGWQMLYSCENTFFVAFDKHSIRHLDHHIFVESCFFSPSSGHWYSKRQIQIKHCLVCINCNILFFFKFGITSCEYASSDNKDVELQPAIPMLKNRSNIYFSTGSLEFYFETQTEILISSTASEYRRDALESACVLFLLVFFSLVFASHIPFEGTNTRLDLITHTHSAVYCTCIWGMYWCSYEQCSQYAQVCPVYWMCVMFLCRTDDRRLTQT